MDTISILVPMYNEEKRLGAFIPDLCKFLIKQNKENKEIKYSLMLVNDGSKDKTLDKLKEVKKEFNQLKIDIISYKPNQGKGYAVKQGIFNTKTDYLIFVDADGSIVPTEIPPMSEKLLENKSVVLGSRYRDRSKITQPLGRRITSILFNGYVNLLFLLGIKDTLCGFKGFKTSVAKKLFKKVETNRWIFDVELLWHIKKSKTPFDYLNINWHWTEGSTIKALDPIKMAFDLLKLRLRIK